MKLIVQRVSTASVTVDGIRKGAIGKGYMVLVGCRHDDATRDAEYLANRLAALRIFHDADGKMNLSISQVGGSVLLVSQFTLYADTKSGNRPGFTLAGDPAKAESVYLHFVDRMRKLLGDSKVECGEFGAEMQVALVNEGPVTIELCSDSQPWHGQNPSTNTSKAAAGSGIIFSKVESDADAAATFELASRIWNVCYKDIISPDQIAYMLAGMYSPETIRRETRDGTPFYLVRKDGADIGLLSYDLKPDSNGVLYLHKIYLAPDFWSKGVGQEMLSHVIRHARKAGANAVELNVNKNNERALRSYGRAGFAKAGERVTDIGHGYIMDDFLMRKEIK